MVLNAPLCALLFHHVPKQEIQHIQHNLCCAVCKTYLCPVKKQAVAFAVVVLALLYSFLVSAYSYVPVTAAVPTTKGKSNVQSTAVSAGSVFYITAAYRLHCTAPVGTEPGTAAKQGLPFTTDAVVTDYSLTPGSLQYLQRQRLQCVNLQTVRLLFPFHHFW